MLVYVEIPRLFEAFANFASSNHRRLLLAQEETDEDDVSDDDSEEDSSDEGEGLEEGEIRGSEVISHAVITPYLQKLLRPRSLHRKYGQMYP